MAISIMQGYNENKYITFGDEERMYELIGSPDTENAGQYNFELRRDGDPNYIFTELNVEGMENKPMNEVFVKALETAQGIMDKKANEYASQTPFPAEARDGLEHLQHYMSVAIYDLNNNLVTEQEDDFSAGVASIPAPEEGLNQ